MERSLPGQSCFRQQPSLMPLIVIAIFLLCAAGCAGSGKPPYDVQKYLLTYESPSFEASGKLPVSVKVNRFSIAAAYNSTGMIFRDDVYGLDTFNYSRWAVNPADMIGDLLLADMRAGNLFQAVLSRYDLEEGRFILSGGIEEFFLRTEKKNKTARLVIAVSLQDSLEKETGKRMMYQKTYTREAPLQDVSPKGYCAAASQAMQALSREIIGDVYSAVKARMP
ncbi:MAG TPA: ABC-type transport auxiliary lipoprotein family protein [Smithellaceae bacterium]|nr:ABC-type transport auxiliary lipoprotein family protein [Smithellaceae bacterium]HRV45575.1 ABC-type transport auxiliary lipoprotein family protein [Smithellaceae bacterium]